MLAESSWSRWSPSVTPYGILIRLFVDGRLKADEFEVVFLRLYKADPTVWPADVFDVLDGFFGDVDAFCSDSTLRGEVGGIDEDELRLRAQVTLRRLEDFVP